MSENMDKKQENESSEPLEHFSEEGMTPWQKYKSRKAGQIVMMMMPNLPPALPNPLEPEMGLLVDTCKSIFQHFKGK